MHRDFFECYEILFKDILIKFKKVDKVKKKAIKDCSVKEFSSRFMTSILFKKKTVVGCESDSDETKKSKSVKQRYKL